MNVTDNLRDAAYIAIGMGVISAQRAQVRREELRKQFAEVIKQADAAVEPVRKAVEAQIDNALELLPEQAKPLVQQVRSVVGSTPAAR